VAQHRHQRNHPGAAADQVERAALVDRPCERPADRSADLELVAGDRLVDEMGETSPSSKRSIVSSTASYSGAEAIEYERDA
jgi:hypothetical protein